MTINKAVLRGFRCFDRYDISFDPQVTILAGPNGSGKTSVLEALYVASRMRSFRTPTLSDLVKKYAPAFSLRVTTDHEELHIAQGEEGTISEINGQGPVTRWKLLESLSLVSIIEQDIEIIQGYPEARRTFFDQASVLQRYPLASAALGKYQNIYRQRVALLNDPAKWHQQSYCVITEQFWRATDYIRTMRRATMATLEQKINELFVLMVPGESCSLQYIIPDREKNITDSDSWCATYEQEERRLGRSLMGAHLDDIEIVVGGLAARRFASRGMQKALVVLFKIAQAQLTAQAVPQQTQATLILDDIMADFDEERLKKIMDILATSQLQLIFTAPESHKGYLEYQNLFPPGLWVRLGS
jgi:DNA replication and repair protein RecF